MHLPFHYHNGILHGPDNFALKCYESSFSPREKAMGDCLGQTMCDRFNSAYQANPAQFMAIGRAMSQQVMELPDDVIDKLFVDTMTDALYDSKDRHQ